MEHRSAISECVSWRRSGDKLGPFLRWARARTRTLSSPSKKRSRVKKLLGASTVITDHALGHFIDERDLNPLWGRSILWRPRKYPHVWPELAIVQALLLRAFESHHDELNAFLKGARQPVVQNRDDLQKLARDAWSLARNDPFARALARFLERLTTGGRRVPSVT